MLGTRKATHVGPNLGDEDLSCALTNAWNRIQEGDGLLVCGQTPGNFSTDMLNGFRRGYPAYLNAWCEIL